MLFTGKTGTERIEHAQQVVQRVLRENAALERGGYFALCICCIIALPVAAFYVTFKFVDIFGQIGHFRHIPLQFYNCIGEPVESLFHMRYARKPDSV